MYLVINWAADDHIGTLRGGGAQHTNFTYKMYILLTTIHEREHPAKKHYCNIQSPHGHAR